MESTTKNLTPIKSNLTTQRPTCVTHLECGMHGDRYQADQVYGLSKAGKPLIVKCDCVALPTTITKEEFAARPADMWRYRDFLPLRRTENIVSLGEIHTPLVPISQLHSGSGSLLVKDGWEHVTPR